MVAHRFFAPQKQLTLHKRNGEMAKRAKNSNQLMLSVFGRHAALILLFFPSPFYIDLIPFGILIAEEGKRFFAFNFPSFQTDCSAARAYLSDMEQEQLIALRNNTFFFEEVLRPSLKYCFLPLLISLWGLWIQTLLSSLIVPERKISEKCLGRWGENILTTHWAHYIFELFSMNSFATKQFKLVLWNHS